MNKPVVISDKALARAEARAREEGFASVSDYLDALIEDDGRESKIADWVRARLEEGIASGNTGDMTREKLDRLVGEGIARADRMA